MSGPAGKCRAAVDTELAIILSCGPYFEDTPCVGIGPVATECVELKFSA